VEPLNIEINGLALDTVVGAGYNDEPITLLDAIINAAVVRLSKEDEYREVHGGLRKRVAAIRDEEIRALVKPELEAAMTAPITPTNHWGEPTTGKTTTLRELIVAHATKFFTEKTDEGYNRPQSTAAQRVVAEAVEKELTAELRAAVADEKAKVVAAVRAKAAELIATAVKEGVGR
jgi:hypothetical protein